MRSLRRQLALWTSAATLLGLVVFAIAASIVVTIEERSEAESGVLDSPGEIAAEAREEMLIAFAIAAPFGIALAVAAATWGSRRTMASVDRAARTAAEISVDRFDRRMELPPDGHELRPLAEAINDLLTRLQRGYDALAAFSADASHELRTPLAAVCSELEVGLRRARSAEDWEVSARTSLAELRRLSGVVDAMLRFAQADATRAADAAEVDAGEVVAEVVAIHGAIAERAQVALEAELGDAALLVRGDAELLATALANLVANALRMTPAGGRVRVALEPSADAIVIAVEDTGPGLPADPDALFVPFSRGASGVGLGLAIARRIVERHGGKLACADRAPGGARFTIELPRVHAS